jgi:heme-degrading monooxygenase HmoA
MNTRMAVMAIVRYAGDSEELKFGLARMLALAERRRPEGYRFHSSGVTEDGIVLVDIWSSEEAFTAWRRDPEFQIEFRRTGLPRPSHVELLSVITTWPDDLSG